MFQDNEIELNRPEVIEAKRLREIIYGPISEQSWKAVCEMWVADLPWLRKQVLNMEGIECVK